MSKHCMVPKCPNTSIKTPDKLFFNVPRDVKLRKKWFSVSKRDPPRSFLSTLNCCEDHFDIENDMENYIKYKLVGGILKLKKGVLPHKFACQKRTVEKPERSVVQKRRRNEIIHRFLHEPLPNSIASESIEEIFIVDAAKESAPTDPADPLRLQLTVEEEKQNEPKTRSIKVQVCIKPKLKDKSTMTDDIYFEPRKSNVKRKKAYVRKGKKNVKCVKKEHNCDTNTNNDKKEWDVVLLNA